VRKNPSLTTVLVSYYAGPQNKQTLRIAPVVNSFTLNKYGKNTELILTSALLLTEVRIFSGPYLEKEAKHLCFW
jgi:hypothetical protein